MDKRYDHTAHEPTAQQRWEREQTYAPENAQGPLFSIDTPPPTVSGSLHIGHIFSYTQTDIIARYQRLAGHTVFYPFGFDDNGLPTERYVEKKHKVSAHAMGRSEFIKLCQQESAQAEKTFEELWRRMGISADWRECYSTISDRVRALSQESFLRLLSDGLVYRKHEPAPYCTTCRTSVAQAELDDAEKPSTFNDIVFTLKDGTQLIVGTTRPELLSSCVALLYHPDDARYQKLAGKQTTVPVFGFAVPILADEAVQQDKGTGLVMCCTFGDKTDIAWYKKFDLPYKQSIGPDGKFTQETGILSGLKVPQARERILEELKKQGLLKNQKAITHTVNMHERCKKEVEFVALNQWFLNILEHKEKFLELAHQINWHPAYMKARYINWVENLNWDWCLSRQRFYGIPFPVWHCSDCGETLTADLKTLPVDPQETAYPGKTCSACSSSNVVPDTDVMDTWNTSSLTPYICWQLHAKTDLRPLAETVPGSFLPMSMRPQAHDIIRTWAFYTIIKTWFHHRTIPWKDIVISGHVLASGKEKLSKSKNNNALAPEKLLERYPADAIRFWTASGTLGTDITFSEEQLRIGSKLLNKLWNAFRFVQLFVQELDVPTTQPNNLGPVNDWILHRAHATFSRYQTYFADYEFSLALHELEQLFWHDFCDNYLELIKDQLFNRDRYDSATVAATAWAVHTVGLRILQLYAPYLPHVTETIFQELYQQQGVASLHQTQHMQVQTAYEVPESTALVQHILKIVAEVRRLKTEHQLALRTELAQLTVHATDQKMADALQEQEMLLRGVTRAQEVNCTTDVGQTQLVQKGEKYSAEVAV